MSLWCRFRAGGSVDTEMDRLHLHVDTPCAKSASKKSVFGSLERSMDKLLCMLTPKKKRSTPSSFDEPRTVKVNSVHCDWAVTSTVCAVLLNYEFAAITVAAMFWRRLWPLLGWIWLTAWCHHISWQHLDGNSMRCCEQCCDCLGDWCSEVHEWHSKLGEWVTVTISQDWEGLRTSNLAQKWHLVRAWCTHVDFQKKLFNCDKICKKIGQIPQKNGRR